MLHETGFAMLLKLAARRCKSRDEYVSARVFKHWT